MSILDLLRSDGSIVINKHLAREIGLNETIILSELISRSEWHKSKDEDKDGWFYCTQKTLEKQTTLNRYYQDKAIDNLLELNLISKKTTGVPAKRYFKINEKTVVRLVTGQIENNSQTGLQESHKQESDSVTNKSGTQSQEVIKNYNNQGNNQNNTLVDESTLPTLSNLPRKENNRRKYPDQFEEVWSAYPNREGSNSKGEAYRKYRARINEGIEHQELIQSVINYKKECQLEDKTGTPYIKQTATFFGPADHWIDYTDDNFDCNISEVDEEGVNGDPKFDSYTVV